MNKMQIEKVKKSLERIEKIKQNIADQRDKLRDELDDLVGILECFSTAVDDLDAGKRQIEDAIESISGYV